MNDKELERLLLEEHEADRIDELRAAEYERELERNKLINEGSEEE